MAMDFQYEEFEKHDHGLNKRKSFAIIAASLWISLSACTPGPVDPDHHGQVSAGSPVVFTPAEEDPDSPLYCDPYCVMKRYEAARELEAHRAYMRCMAQEPSELAKRLKLRRCTNPVGY